MQGPTLAQAAQRLGLGRWLLLGRGEEATGGRERPGNLADAYEALIARSSWTADPTAASRALDALSSARWRRSSKRCRLTPPN